MNKGGLFLTLFILSVCPQTYAAEQAAPAQTTFNIKADNALKGKLPADIQKRGYIIAGTNPNTPPTTFYEEDNRTLAGREIDIMTAVASRLGVKVQWHDTGGFDNIIPGLKTGRYDVALANISATPERFKQVDFVSYYDASRLGIITRQDAHYAPFNNLIAVCGNEVGAGVGTTHIARLEEGSKICVAQGKPPIKVAVFPDRPAGVQAVISGRIPMFLGPYEGLSWQVSKVRDLALSGEVTIHDAPVSIAFPKGSGLEEAVQAALNSLIQDGSYQKILDHWSIGIGAVKESKRNQEIF